MAYDKGIFVISATQSDSEAHESAYLCHAQFTYILVEDGLVSNLADWRPVDKIITTKEWLQYGAETKSRLHLTSTVHNSPIVFKPRPHLQKSGEMPRKLWEQTPRLFLPDVYSGFDFTMLDLRRQ